MFRSLTNSLYNLYNLSPLYDSTDLTNYSILLKCGDKLLIIEEDEYEQLQKIRQNQNSRILTKFFKLCIEKKKIQKYKTLQKRLKRKKKKKRKYKTLKRY